MSVVRTNSSYKHFTISHQKKTAMKPGGDTIVFIKAMGWCTYFSIARTRKWKRIDAQEISHVY